MSTLAGPTKGAEKSKAASGQWEARPGLARALRFGIFAAPLLVSIIFTWSAGRIAPPESLGMNRWLWIGCVFVLANVLLALLRKATGRLVPLVALMKLTLVFPDHAPSRTKATLRQSNSRRLLREIQDAKANGEDSSEIRYADYLVQLLKDVNEHDRLTRGHSERVRVYAEMIGEEIGLDDDEMNKLRWSALLHDVGKLSVPSEILNSPGRPTDEEWKILSGHPEASLPLLEPLRDWLGDWVHSADQHHCRWDGKGYPYDLAGTDISLAGRLVAVADAYDVMTSTRSYKKPLPVEVARQELTDCAGGQFDPTLVRAFLRISLGRLRFVGGPLAWLANLTGSFQIPVPVAGSVASTAWSTGVAAATVAVTSATGGFVDTPPELLSFAEPVVVAYDTAQTTFEGEDQSVTLRVSSTGSDLVLTLGSPENGTATVTRGPARRTPGFSALSEDDWLSTVVYAPAAGFQGTDRFTFQACTDDECDSAEVTISVVSTNEAPAVGQDEVAIEADQPVRIDVLANDVDPDGDELDVVEVTAPENGVVSIVDGEVSYVPNPGFTGVDTFTYTIEDPEGEPATATVTVTVIAPPEPAPTAPPAPTAADDSGDGFTTDEDVAFITGSVLSNDDSASIDAPPSIRVAAEPRSGSLQNNGDGTFWYSPLPDFNGEDSFRYTIESSDGIVSGEATVTVLVLPVADAPQAVDDQGPAFTVDEGQSITTGDVTENDTDPDGALVLLSIDVVTEPSQGELVNNGDGTFDYTAAETSEGTDTFSYAIVDDDGLASRPATVTITIIGVNDAPVAADDDGAGFTVLEDESFVTANVLDNDSDVDNDLDPESITIVEPTGRGELDSLGDGTFRYTPDPDANGSDTFTYTIADREGAVSNTATVTILIRSVNDGPVAVADSGDGFSTVEDTPFTTGDVTENDLDGESDPDPTTVEVTAGPDHGTLVNNGDGTFVYSPDLNYNGTDTFSYSVADADGLLSPATTVTIVVAAVNDALVLQPDGGEGFTTDEDVAFTTANVLDNDADPDAADDAGDDPEAIDGVAVGQPTVDDSDADQRGRRVGQDDGLAVGEAAVGPYVISVQTAPANGDLVNNGDGTFGYEPSAGFNGTDTFEYVATDAEGVASEPGVVTITVTSVNDAPMAVGDSGDGFVTDEDTAFTTADVTANDTDEDSAIDPGSLVVEREPSLGAVTANDDGTFTYEPSANAFGRDDFTYTVADADGLRSAPATVTIQVAAVNDVPVAVDDVFATSEDVAFTTGVVTGNDRDVDGDVDPGSVQIVGEPGFGSLTANGDGTFAYVPDADANGTDSFTYTVADVDGLRSAPATVTIEVASINDAPIAVDDAYETFEDLPFRTGNVASNDRDVEDGAVAGRTVEIVDEPRLGSLTSNGNGTFEYVPDADANGTDSFTYRVSDSDGAVSEVATVTITVLPGNDPPVAGDDGGDAFTTDEDTAFTTPAVTANDTDIEDLTVDPATVVVLTDAAHGRLAKNSDGTFTYSPNPDFNGIDTFTYIVNDSGLLASNEATVTITVTAVNDAPVAEGNRGDGFTTTEDEPFTTASVLTNDADVEDGTVDASTVEVTSDVSNGVLAYRGDGTFRYEPNANFHGTDTFAYAVADRDGALSNDALVIIEVAAVNDAPIAADDAGDGFGGSEDTDLITASVIANDSDIEDATIDPATISVVASPTQGQVVSNGDGTFTYSPDADTNGTDTFAYVVVDSDGATSAPAVVQIEIAPINDEPGAESDGGAGFETAEDTQLVTPNLLENDSDVEDDTLDPSTITVESGPSNGTVTPNGDGTFTYSPNPDFNGIDTFTYTFADSAGAVSNLATVTIAVASLNDAPVAVDDLGAAFTTDEDEPFTTASVLDNDADVEDGTIDPATIVVVEDVAAGTLEHNGDGTFDYTPAADSNGEDSFTYTVTDSAGRVSEPAEVTLLIRAVNDAPIAADDHGVGFTGAEDNVLMTSSILDNDYDVEDGTIGPSTIVILDDVDFGTLVSNGDGSFDYTPTLNFNGDDSFTYRVEDSDGTSSEPATVTITVVAGDDPPAAFNDGGVGFIGDEDTPLVLPDITANDTDPEDGTIDPTTVMIVDPPASGTLDMADDGTLTYTPNEHFNGVDTFIYKVADTSLLESNVATVILEIRPVNDPPDAVDDGGADFVVEEDTMFTTPNVVANDSDVEDDTIDVATVELVGAPVGASVVNNFDGTFNVTPEPNFVGTASFQYTIDDSEGAVSDAAHVTISVLEVNDPPVANDDGGPDFTVLEDNAFTTGIVVANDTDLEDGNLSAEGIEVLTEPAHGDLVQNADGSFDYTPDDNTNGPSTFTYRIADSAGLWSDPATVTITVVAVNDAPEAIDDSGAGFEVEENGQLATPDVTLNDFDVEDGAIDASTVRVSTTTANGSLTNNGDGTFDYEPDDDFNGQDIFTYTVTDADGEPSPPATVTISVAAVNDVPVAAGDGGADYTTDEDTSFTTPVITANDRDPEDGAIDPSTIEITANPSHGQLVDNNDGTFTYTPDQDFYGDDSFTYRVTDAEGLPSDDATVSIVVEAVNDAPSVAQPGPQETLVVDPFSLQISVDDVEGDLVGFSASGLPPGLAVSSSGLISGTVPTGGEGTYEVTINVTDNGLPSKTTSITFEIVVRTWLLSQSEGDLVITEIGGFGGAPSREFIEVTNVSEAAIDLTGWQLYDFNLRVESAGDLNFTFGSTDYTGDESTLQPGEIAVVWLGSDDGATDPASGLEYVITDGTYKFGNSGDDAWLVDPDRGLADYVALGSGSQIGEGPPAEFDIWDDSFQGTNTPVLNVSHSVTPHGAGSNLSGCWERTGSGDAVGRCPGALPTYDLDNSFVFVSSPGFNNNAFRADAGGPYSITQGEDLTLDGSGTPNTDGTYRWDLNGDDDFGDVTGVNPTLSWTDLVELGLGSPGDYDIVLSVEGAIDDAAATVTILDDGQVVDATGAATANAGMPYELTLSNDDQGAGGFVEWTVNWGDGTIETFASPDGAPITVSHAYNGPGLTYGILVSGKDTNGNVYFDNNLLVPSFDQNKLFVFGADGNVIGEGATAADPLKAVVGPDGLVYVSTENDGSVYRFDADTGDYLDTFIASGSGGMDKSGGLAFGPYGDLYVANTNGKNVLRFDGDTGALLGVFASDGLEDPYDIIFDSNTNMYVADYNTEEVRRYSSADGSLIDVFVESDAGGLKDPEQMAFGPDGNLYVASFNTDRVLRFSGLDGAFIDTFINGAGIGDTGSPARLDDPSGLAFGPDGNLYAVDYKDHSVLRFDGATGAFIDEFIAPGAGGITKPVLITFVPNLQVTIS